MHPINRDKLIAQLRQLPRWGVVALAVRAARRVQPLFDLPKTASDRWKHLQSVEFALGLAESANSASPRAKFSAADAYAAADAYSYASASAAYASAAYAAAAASAATDAYAAAADNDDDAAAADAYAAARIAATRAAAAAAFDADIRRLVQLALPDDSWVDPTAAGPLGPLWPDGPPGWYVKRFPKMQAALAEARRIAPHRELIELEQAIAQPAANVVLPPANETHAVETGGELEITLEIPAGTSQEEMAKAIRRLMKAANREHRRLGGAGLTVDSLEIESLVEAGVPV